MAKLSDLTKNQEFKMSNRGMCWKVIFKVVSKFGFNSVIQIESQNGSRRTYSSNDTAWDQQVILK